MFYLNRTSTESMFTEAQLYENISRIVKLLDYKPIGYQTSTLAFGCSAQGLEPGSYTIPRYSYLNIGNVPFSFNEDVSFNIASTTATDLADLTNRKILYQGIYRENPTHVAAGDSNEVVTINISNTLIDHFNVDVYVYENQQNLWVKYNEVPSLYTKQAFDRSFEKRLNSNLLYEISFGNGINGRKLERGDEVAIFYLQSSGNQGVVGPGALFGAGKSIFTNAKLQTILSDTNEEQLTYLTSSLFQNLYFNNTVGSTVPKNIEDSESIKRNAPANFKSQYRLVTKGDFETFIKTNFATFIGDVKIFSNWDYTGNYLKYFNDIQVSPVSYRQILLNHVLYADSCNFNNTYICAIPKVSQGSSLKYLLPAQKEIILSNIKQLKTLTSEIVFLDPVFKAVSFGVKNENDEVFIEDADLCELLLVKSGNSRRSIRSIQNEAESTFKEFFNPINAKLGGTFAYSTLVNQLLSIDGVSQIRTRRIDTDEYFEGLSFFMWNPTYPDLDKRSIVNNIEVQDFEFVYFENLQSISSKIQVIENQTFIQ